MIAYNIILGPILSNLGTIHQVYTLSHKMKPMIPSFIYYRMWPLTCTYILLNKSVAHCYVEMCSSYCLVSPNVV